MEVEERGLIFDATGRREAERVASFTALCPLRSETILAGFQLGPAKHSPASTIGLCRSRDGGRTWSRIPWMFASTLDAVPGSLSGPEMVEAEPGRLLLFTTWFDRQDPDRPLFDPVTEGILPSKQLMAVSGDEGETWSHWREIPTPGLTGCAMTGPPLLWPDGTLAFCFESFKTFDDPAPGRHGAWMLVSKDGGRAFSRALPIAQHPEHAVYYWDQRLCVGRRSGAFIALFWTHDLRQHKDLTVHQKISTVAALTPANARTVSGTPIPGQIAAPFLLDDGRLLAFVVDRDRPGTLTLWHSPDSGTTWPLDRKLVVHTHDEQAVLSQGKDNIDFTGYWEDMSKWSFGHPAIRSLPDGRVLLAYYAGSPACMSVHWARIRTG